ncbi:hypothetical protein SAMN02745164_00392 [Marinitoga hydrogenitolerans DSM 16785]|uniref:Right handed beta helix domain-containing protein n=1 Tax=Marinitoga hydrogenitolerans (strain DSM 16785 / JCM 12826 / AT1271) TaxID=1122195 RepID=A0A1M4TBU0_MARH1|nr:hypothetical protein [Marinitoga hydrogenitolerans]SHE41941.1 hypothetical protein SAMN02745164_00392 [Marinitoga hydrogenitolerans DSM 16785]
MKKIHIFWSVVIIIIALFLFLKPVKIQITLEVPDSLKGLNYVIKIKNREYKNSAELWIFPGKYNVEVELSDNKIIRELKVPYFVFSKRKFQISLEKPIINVDYERKDYDEIWIYLNCENYKLDYWKIYFDGKEYQTSLAVYKLFVSPYVNGNLKVKGYIQNKIIHEKDFNLQAPLSEIKDYKIKIDDYINISLEINHKMIDPIKYEIYKNNEFIESINKKIYKDKFTYDEVLYKIIPVYPSGYKGEEIKIIKPKLPEIPEKINKKEVKIDIGNIILNGKEYNSENFVEGENNLIIKINNKVSWYKKIFLDTTPPKLERFSLKYNKTYNLSLFSNEKAKYKLITKESTYTFEGNTFDFISLGKEATLLVYDELNNVSKPILLKLNPFPEYTIKEFDNSVSLKFEKNFVSEFCELRILDEANTLITRINIKKLNEFSFSNFLPGKEYKFVLYIDEKFNKEIYNKILPPILPVVKSIENKEVGIFEISFLDDYKYNFYKVEFKNYTDKGNFSGKTLKLKIPLEILTNEGTLILWREFKGLKTEELKFNIKDNFLFGKKLYTSLKTVNSYNSPYIISNDINIEKLDVEGVVRIYVFPEKSIIINGSIKFKDNNSKLIIRPVKDTFESIILNSGNLKNTEIYNANVGIVINNTFNLYNLVIKNCKTGIYEKGFSGEAYNVIISDNRTGMEIVDGDIEIKNSLFFDNETTFRIYNSKAYLYNLSVADSKLDIDLYNSDLKIKTSDFLNSIESINSAYSNLYINTTTFKNNDRTIKSREDKSLLIQKVEFINNKISLDIFKSPFNIDSSKFVNNEKSLNVFNSNNDKKFLIKNTLFENNKIDIYIEGSNDVYLENTKVTNFYDGNIESTWINERGKILNRGKIIFKGGTK